MSKNKKGSFSALRNLPSVFNKLQDNETELHQTPNVLMLITDEDVTFSEAYTAYNGLNGLNGAGESAEEQNWEFLVLY